MPSAAAWRRKWRDKDGERGEWIVLCGGGIRKK
jgi:hypothetical protein